MNDRRHLTIVTLLLLGTMRAFAADITGTWKASVDTPSNDEIKFTRQVADFATEELVAKRVK